MAWKVFFDDDHVVDFDDLSPEFFGRLADDDKHGDSWLTIYNQPLLYVDRYTAIVNACAAHVGVEWTPPTRMGDIDRLFDMFVRTEDVADVPMADGLPLGNEVETPGSTSGAPNVSDGLPTSSDDSESETS